MAKIKQIDGLQTALDAKANKVTVETATKAKITYNAEGIVTGGADLSETDIPALSIAKTTGLQTALDGKVDENTAITGATKCKITYDAKGLVTSGADLGSSDLPTVPVTKGGTGLTTVTSGSFLKGNGTGNLTERTASEMKTDLSLNNVTNDAQVKKAASSTNGSIPKWNGTSGDTIVDGYTVQTTVRAAGSATDSAFATELAVRTAINAVLGANDAMVFKGVIDCSTNPNYPSGVQGDTHRVSVAGKIGGASGVNVEVGDMVLCITDNAGGTHATVGSSWSIIQVNIDGAVTGPASATDNHVAVFDGTSGKLIKGGGQPLSAYQTALVMSETVYTGASLSYSGGVTTIANVFPTAPPAGAMILVAFNGCLIPKGAADTTGRWWIDTTSLKFKTGFTVDTNDEVHVIIQK